MCDFRCAWNEPPKTVPISKADWIQVIDEYPMHMTVPMMDMTPKLFGVDCEFTDRADYVRTNRLDVPVSQYISEALIDDAMNSNSEVIFREGIRAIKSHILSDKTRITITLEWDVWAKIKRLLHITRWFPVKTVSTEVDCKILYPYCKVTFPHNKHSFHVSAKDIYGKQQS